MGHRSTVIKKYSLPAFLILTVLLTVFVSMIGLAPFAVPILMVLIPALLAVLLTGAVDGRAGVAVLLRKLLEWKVNLRWYVILIGLALAIRLGMSLLALLLGWTSSIAIRGGTPATFVTLAALLLPAAFLEELGWRAYALPRLLQRHSALFSALLIGVVWGSLHLLLLLPNMMYEGENPLALLLEMIGLSVVITWLFVQTRGNIVITSLYHAAQSFFVILNEGISLSQQTWLMAIVYVVASLILVIVFGARLRGRAKQETTVLGVEPKLGP